MDLWVDSNLLNADPRSSIDKIYFLCVKLEIYFLFHIKCIFYVKLEKKMFRHYTTLKSSVL